MKKLFPISLCLAFVAWIGISWLAPEKNNPITISVSIPAKNISIENEAAEIYDTLQLDKKGLSANAFNYAYKGYKKLLAKGIIKSELLTICDFSQSSKKKRLYIVDIENNEVLLNTYVAHGKNSGREFATKFSNRPSSLQSSLGFYITKNTYYGEHGLSLKVEGLEPGFNDKAYKRAIVIHGADYIEPSWLDHSNYMGRSFGCPAVPDDESKFIVNTIKNGSCLFIYHPSKNYLNKSKILNG